MGDTQNLLPYTISTVGVRVFRVTISHSFLSLSPHFIPLPSLLIQTLTSNPDDARRITLLWLLSRDAAGQTLWNDHETVNSRRPKPPPRLRSIPVIRPRSLAPTVPFPTPARAGVMRQCVGRAPLAVNASSPHGVDGARRRQSGGGSRRKGRGRAP